MAKKIIRTNLDYNWIEEFEGWTVRDVTEKLLSFDPDIKFETDYDWDNTWGVLLSERMETDEEEQARELKEAKEKAAAAKLLEEQKQWEEASVQQLIEKVQKVNAKHLDFVIKHASHPAIHTLAHMFEAAEVLEAKGDVEDAEHIRMLMDAVLLGLEG